ncbi:hypothetical protein [Curvivirga aplysinae]|uniref:hypothetical protein n=1 Tax=Curvivirga aplysinae TaxID=2529852 RepID=UPI0012BC4343|nr:hypothetical protein [Curvivirga aplysinae]MTI10380.1 hypothetical protein [Curvivirga aplysinae]
MCWKNKNNFTRNGISFVSCIFFFGLTTISSIAADEYKASDGTIIKREFFGKIKPKRTIVVCSDNQEFYLKRLHRFNEYVLADKSYVILNGQNDIVDVESEEVTLVYFGTANSPVDDNKCLKKFSGFLKSVAEVRAVFEDENYIDNILGPGASERFTPLLCHNTLTKDYKKSISLRRDTALSCVHESFEFLFHVRTNVCSKNCETFYEN